MRNVLLLVLGIYSGLPAVAAEAPAALPTNPEAYRNTDLVLSIMADSRQVRTLKNADESVREVFIQTLRSSVYDQVDEAVLSRVRSLPEYAGKQVMVHEFRTPGSDPNDINADRDARVLVEVEQGRWLEVPRQDWEDTFYEAFGEASGKPDNVDVRAHADRYRQLATDRVHREASLDYTDQTLNVVDTYAGRRLIRDSTIVQARDADGSLAFDDGGRPILAGESNVQSVLAAGPENRSRLRDAEGLGYMYFEKGDEQLRKAADFIADPEINAMHRSEAAVQIRKGVRSLDNLRASYTRQGYDVGQLPDNFQQASRLINAYQGDMDADPFALERQLRELGFDQGLSSFNERLQGQMESLQLARRTPPPAPPREAIESMRSDVRAGRALAAANFGQNLGGKVLEVLDFMESAERIEAQAERGEYLYFDLDENDSAFARNAQVYAATLIETTGIPAAMEAGWEADENERRRIEEAIRRGETVDPFLSTARVMADVGTNAVKTVILDPVQGGVDKTVEIANWAQAVATENAALDTLERQQLALAGTRLDRLQRENEFNLDLIQKWHGSPGGESLVGPVSDGSAIAFSVARDTGWTDDLEVEWSIPELGLNRRLSAAEPSANQFGLTVQDWPVGTYQVRLTVRGSNGLVYGQESTSFELNPQAALGTLTARVDELDGPLLDDLEEPLVPGRIVAFDVVPLGQWGEAIDVEWLVDGESYKTTPGTGDNAELIRFRTDHLEGTGFTIAVRLLDRASGAILDHRDRRIDFTRPATVVEPFSLRASLDNYDGPALNEAIRNGDIVAFSADLVFPEADPVPITNLFWQVFDASGQPVPGLSKTEQVVLGGQQQQFGFRFRPETLANGDYQVQLTASLASDPEQRQQARIDLAVFESVSIQRLVVSADAAAQLNRETLYADEAPHLFVYYDLDGSTTVSAELTVNNDRGETVFSDTVERQANDEAEQRVGVRLEPGAIAVGETATFNVSLQASDGLQVQASQNFSVSDYVLDLALPERLQAGETERFEIGVPDNFTPPFEVDLDSYAAVTSMDSKLGGTISGIADGSESDGQLSIVLTDSEGRVARLTKPFIVEPEEVRVVQSPSASLPVAPRITVTGRSAECSENRYYSDSNSSIRDGDIELSRDTLNLNNQELRYSDSPKCLGAPGEHPAFYAETGYSISLCGRRIYVFAEELAEFSDKFRSEIIAAIDRAPVSLRGYWESGRNSNIASRVMEQNDVFDVGFDYFAVHSTAGPYGPVQYCVPDDWPY